MRFSPLSRLHNLDDKTVGVKYDNKEEKLILSSKNTIQYLSLDGICMHNYVLKGSKSLSHAAIQNHTTRRFYAVQGNITLLTWNEGEDMNKAKAIKMDSPVANLYTFPQLNQNILVLLSNGNIQVISLATISKTLVSGNESIILWSNIDSNNITNKIYLTSVCKATNNNLIISNVEICVQDDYSICFSLAPFSFEAINRAELTLSSCCFNTSDFSLSLIWSDSIWDTFYLKQKHLLRGGLLNGVTRKLDNSVSSDKNGKNGDHKRGRGSSSTFESVSVYVGDSLCVGRMEKQETEEEESNGQFISIQCWDSHHSILAFEVKFKMEEEENEEERVVSLFLSADSSKIFLITSRNIYFSSINLSPLSLASALGLTVTNKNPVLPIINDVAILTTVVDFKKIVNEMDVGVSSTEKWSSKLTTEDDEESVILALSSKKNKNKKSFLKTFNDFVSKANEHTTFSHRFVSIITSLCLSLDLWEPIIYFLERECLSSATCPTLADVCIKNGRLDVIEKIILHMHDLPERGTIAIIRHLLKGGKGAEISELEALCKSEKLSSLFGAEGCKKTWEGLCFYLIGLSLSISYNRVFMILNLSKLSISEVTFLLHVFKGLLSNYAKGSLRNRKVRDSNIKKSHVPSLRTTLEWVSMVIESHFPIIVRESNTNEDLKEILFEIQKLCESHLSICNQLFTINGYVSQLRKKEVKNNHEFIPEYSIEVLRI